MANQKIIDKYLSEYYEIHRKTLPISVNSYIHLIVDESIKEHERLSLNSGQTFDEWLKKASKIVRESVINNKKKPRKAL